MHNPSYFYHIYVDLSKPSPHADTALKTESSSFFTILLDQELKDNVTSKHESKADRRDVVEQKCTADLSQARDWRWGLVSLRSMNMSKEGLSSNGTHANTFPTSSGGLATTGHFEPFDSGEEELGWGIVRLYRDVDDTHGLYDDPSPTKSKHGGRDNGIVATQSAETAAFRDEDCTMLCILAVPSYLTPSDFLGFVGEKTWEEVSHFRMIRTERHNRYMVLMKFRSGKKAREWRKMWNGRFFNEMEVSKASKTSTTSWTLPITSQSTVMSSS